MSSPVSRPLTPAAERASARRAAKRRRNVLALVLLANAVVVGLAVARVVTWPWVAAPVAVLVAWLVACRRVGARRASPARVPFRDRDRPAAGRRGGGRRVRAHRRDRRGPAAAPRPDGARPHREAPPAADTPAVLTGEVPVVGGWDMVPTTLPTYVSKPAAQRRTVSTIDLDSTGVWSSGHHDGDSALARSAEQSAKDRPRGRRDPPRQRRLTSGHGRFGRRRPARVSWRRAVRRMGLWRSW